jgi:uncharacterized protein involved in exopolysaccharide biosynthesis
MIADILTAAAFLGILFAVLAVFWRPLTDRQGKP